MEPERARLRIELRNECVPLVELRRLSSEIRLRHPRSGRQIVGRGISHHVNVSPAIDRDSASALIARAAQIAGVCERRIDHQFLPIRIIITNSGDRPISLNDVRINFIPAHGDRLPAAEPGDIERRISLRDKEGPEKFVFTFRIIIAMTCVFYTFALNV